MMVYLLRRIVQMIPVLLLASFAIFAMLHAVPGGPLGALAGENAPPETLERLARDLGLDQPFLVQYGQWLWNAVQGNFGLSLHSKEPVNALIMQRLPATLQLAFVASCVSLLIGVPVALLSAARPDGWIDRALSAFCALALGLPTFWLGILLILLFAVELRWLPAASGYYAVWADPITALRHLILPAITLGLYVSAVLARFLRASLLSEMRADYVRTARAKGLPEGRILRAHILRNALLPFLTIVGLMMAGFVGGAVVTEAVFTYPGLGRLLIQAISSRDYPLIQGCILVILLCYIFINLLVDLAYALVDPRISY